ncbi:MAG: ABC transporter permease subunit [Nitrososphaerales archaeon]|jgi:ABC-type Na+ efflux pump permease subunit
MRLSKSWIIASKDFKVYMKKKNLIYALIVVPLLVSFLFPGVISYSGNKNGGSGIPASELTVLLPAFTFFYLILAGYLPSSIASYSLVGEKVEKSLEPLLATPTTDSEILLGKGIAAFVPPVVAILGGSAIFMALMDLVTYSKLGYDFFPNWNAAIVLFLMVPLAVIMSVEWNVVVSSRVSDVRAAQQLGILLVIPFAGIYVSGELGIVNLGVTNNLLIVAGILFVVDLLLLYVARATFQREEILTSWK